MSLENLQVEMVELIFSDNAQKSIIHPQQHINIYQNNIFAALIRSLKNSYPLLTRLLGEEFFVQQAKIYIADYPSRSANLDEYGEYFADFLAKNELTYHLSYLVEVATFEWLCHVVSLARDQVESNLNKLKQIPLEKYHDIRFILHPACRLMPLHYPIFDLIDRCNTGQVDHDYILNLAEKSTYLLIKRKQEQLSLLTLSLAEFTFLQGLQNGLNLQQTLESTLAVEPQFNLEKQLAAWINNHIIVDFSIE